MHGSIEEAGDLDIMMLQLLACLLPSQRLDMHGGHMH